MCQRNIKGQQILIRHIFFRRQYIKRWARILYKNLGNVLCDNISISLANLMIRATTIILLIKVELGNDIIGGGLLCEAIVYMPPTQKKKRILTIFG